MSKVLIHPAVYDNVRNAVDRAFDVGDILNCPKKDNIGTGVA